MHENPQHRQQVNQHKLKDKDEGDERAGSRSHVLDPLGGRLKHLFLVAVNRGGLRHILLMVLLVVLAHLFGLVRWRVAFFSQCKLLTHLHVQDV